MKIAALALALIVLLPGHAAATERGDRGAEVTEVGT